ncbi:S41 family peptidase [Winogradskyella vidalii]|uniref:S41 family peptidase n=1 Tax=Winogradskyella vidalii TaxID=2615024 RepID=UPI0015CDAB48|nr:S41 family peptidase [Winogradskyella vidalii]
MKNIKTLLIAGFAALALTSCFDDLDDNIVPSTTLELNDFVWKGLNAVYAYKDNITDLGNNRFASSEAYTEYLNGYASPEALFEALLYEPNTVDEFSVIVSNYYDLEQQLQGISVNNGMSFSLVELPNATSDIVGYVRYVLPNTSAESNGVTRGMIFNTVDGVTLTASNYSALLSATTYTIGLVDYNNNGTTDLLTDDVVTANGETITLTKTEYTENPILEHRVLNVSGNSIGYLMYNNFRIADANLNELNDVFAEFQAAGISDLVLDLRYNGGGSVSTSIWLSSMITGQFTGEVFFKENWNSDIQASIEQDNPEALINPFVDEMVKRNTDNQITYQSPINSLNLTKIHIITTRSSASASELLINGLGPYIDVVQIGTSTRGKPQASITIYDSENFARANANPSHTYAMQPLVYESENADGFSQYYDGIEPTLGFEISERIDDLGQLGDVNERLLAEAIANITGIGRSSSSFSRPLEHLDLQDLENPFHYEMVDQRPSKLNLLNQ